MKEREGVKETAGERERDGEKLEIENGDRAERERDKRRERKRERK